MLLPLNFLRANGIRARERLRTEWGNRICCPSHAHNIDNGQTCARVDAGLALSACLTSPFFYFRQKFYRELTRVKSYNTSGSTVLHKALAEVWRGWKHVWAMGQGRLPLGPSHPSVTNFSSFPGRQITRSKQPTQKVSCLHLQQMGTHSAGPLQSLHTSWISSSLLKPVLPFLCSRPL